MRVSILFSAALLLHCEAFHIPSAPAVANCRFMRGRGVSTVVATRRVGCVEVEAHRNRLPSCRMLPDEEGQEVVTSEDEAGEELGVQEEEEEEEEAVVDPNAELKQRIKELEAQVMQRENELVKAKVNIKERGQTGFMRLAAEVDNYRKRRGQDKMKLEKDAMATVIKSFTPMLEAFENSESVLNLETDKEKQLHSNYQALYRQMMDIFTKMGMTEFFGAQGEIFNSRLHECTGEEFSDEFPKNSIIQCLSRGYEVKGNVIRRAPCIVSLGKDGVLVPEEEEPEEELPEESSGEGEEQVE